MRKLIVVILIFAASTSAWAKSISIVGTWSLVKMEKQDGEGNWIDRCFSPNGLITYTKQGYMAVGINCMAAEKSETPTTEMKDNIFYTGTYEFKNGNVTHHVQNSSDPIFYKKELTRTVLFNDDGTITLQGAGKASTVRLIWKKVK